AGRRVIDRAVLVARMRADIDGLERPNPRPERLARQTQAERPRKHFWEDGENSRAPHVVLTTLGRATSSPPPLAGEGQGGGTRHDRAFLTDPLPNPPPHAGEGADRRRRFN